MSDLGAAPSRASLAHLNDHGDTGHPVTAIVVCYNQAAFVRQCLDSVLAQSVLGQLVIVDDASTDGSQQVIKEWVAERSVDARLILHDTNQGVCRSCNDGAESVRTPYMSFVAADDYWLPNKLLRQLRVMESLPTAYGMVYGDALLCDESGTLLAGRFIGQQTRRLSGNPPAGWVFRELLSGNFIPACNVLMRTSCFREVGGLDEALVYEDYDFWLRLSRRYKFWHDDSPLAVYRVRPGSMVRTSRNLIPMRLDTVKIYHRYVDVDGPDRRFAKQALGRELFGVFAAGAPVGARYLWLSLRMWPHWKPAVLLPLAILGLDGQRYRRIRGWMGRLRVVRRLGGG
jgi:glycosyltransferase involved in cell wall biosynthesis